jgi:AcrR family transcriptional regulator
MLRDRLIDAALCEFAQLGFAGASTRSIAAAAKTTMSAITYHFGGKQGLYLAAAMAVARHWTMRGLAGLGPAADTRAPGPARAEIRRAAAHLMSRLDDPVDRLPVLFTVRANLENDDAFAWIFREAIEPIVAKWSRLLAAINPAADDRAIRIEARALFSRALGAAAARGMSARFADSDDQRAFAEHQVDRIVGSASLCA